MPDFDTARLNMVESQLRPNRVSDERLLDAFETVPRERFVPETLRSITYVDEDLKIAPGRYMMEPMVLARLLQTAAIEPGDMVLVIGAATGYACAVAAHLAATVVGLESDTELAEQAEGALEALSVDNGVIVRGSLTEGYPKQAPYNVILINGAVQEIPSAIANQLADGGRLVTVERSGTGMGKAVLMERFADSFGRRNIFDAATPILPGFEKAPGFVF
jgi:protein-L-isoaspartate(D-aspartate) O-methyltransferase